MIEKNWKELIKPAKLMVKHNDDQKSNATIIAEPIERGFGVTIGNALRRISQMQLHMLILPLIIH